MRKAIITAMMIITLAAGLIGCARKPAPTTPPIPSPTPPTQTIEPTVGIQSADAPVVFAASYLRTNGYISGKEYPVITVINDRAALDTYYEQNKDAYDLGPRQTVSTDSTAGFADAMTKYTDEFFRDNYLVLVLLEEGSGSVRHRVERVSSDGMIEITRIVPEVGTDDMAEWHVIIELQRGDMPGQWRTVFSGQ